MAETSRSFRHEIVLSFGLRNILLRDFVCLFFTFGRDHQGVSVNRTIFLLSFLELIRTVT